MPRPIEVQVDQIRRDMIRMDNEIMALKAQLVAQKLLADTVQDFMYKQWPEIREELGELRGAASQMVRIYDKMDELEKKIDSTTAGYWKLYAAIGALAVGGGSIPAIIASLFGGG